MQTSNMKGSNMKIALMAAIAAIAATATFAAPSAYAAPFKSNMKLSNGPGPGPGPGLGPKPGLSNHGHGFHGHHGWGAAGLGLGLVGMTAAAIADDDCFYVRRKLFVPGVGVVKRRQLVCG